MPFFFDNSNDTKNIIFVNSDRLYIQKVNVAVFSVAFALKGIMCKMARTTFFITVFGFAYMLNIASIRVIAVTGIRYFDK